MKSLRVSLAAAALVVLSASTLHAQAARVACKDGSQPKVGHFTCWGHGGVVAAPAKSKPAAKPATGKPAPKKAAKKAKAAKRRS